MCAKIIVSYDGTPNDDDALALGRALAAGGATLALAYVRHSREFDPQREELAQHDAERRLRAGAELLGDPDVPQHVIFSPSTSAGLERLVTEQGASLIVFGSDYRTPPGRAEPGNTAQGLLDGGPVAVAIARAGLRTQIGRPLQTIGAGADAGDPEVQETIEHLVQVLDAQMARDGTPLDLIVVGSSPGGAPGRVSLGGRTRSQLNSARGSVLVLARGAALAL